MLKTIKNVFVKSVFVILMTTVTCLDSESSVFVENFDQTSKEYGEQNSELEKGSEMSLEGATQNYTNEDCIYNTFFRTPSMDEIKSFVSEEVLQQLKPLVHNAISIGLNTLQDPNFYQKCDTQKVKNEVIAFFKDFLGEEWGQYDRVVTGLVNTAIFKQLHNQYQMFSYISRFEPPKINYEDFCNLSIDDQQLIICDGNFDAAVAISNKYQTKFPRLKHPFEWLSLRKNNGYVSENSRIYVYAPNPVLMFIEVVHEIGHGLYEYIQRSYIQSIGLGNEEGLKCLYPWLRGCPSSEDIPYKLLDKLSFAGNELTSIFIEQKAIKYLRANNNLFDSTQNQIEKSIRFFLANRAGELGVYMAAIKLYTELVTYNNSETDDGCATWNKESLGLDENASPDQVLEKLKSINHSFFQYFIDTYSLDSKLNNFASLFIESGRKLVKQSKISDATKPLLSCLITNGIITRPLFCEAESVIYALGMGHAPAFITAACLVSEEAKCCDLCTLCATPYLPLDISKEAIMQAINYANNTMNN
jgi:hypothetical protein